MSNDTVPVISAAGTECPPQYRYNADTLYSVTYVANLSAQLSINLPNYTITSGKKIALAQAVPSLNSKVNRA
jgi:hypothetical protein